MIFFGKRLRLFNTPALAFFAMITHPEFQERLFIKMRDVEATLMDVRLDHLSGRATPLAAPGRHREASSI